MKKIFVFSIKALVVFSLLFALACGKSDKVKLKIGQLHQGGIIFYLDETGKHGLIAAPEDQTTSTGIQWYNGSYIETGATGRAIGTGKSNTTKIVQAQGNGSYAARLCDGLVLNGYSDWFLPSKDELNELCINKEAIGGFSDGIYWSSSERITNEADETAWGQFFGTGYQGNDYISSAHRVRAVRAF